MFGPLCGEASGEGCAQRRGPPSPLVEVPGGAALP